MDHNIKLLINATTLGNVLNVFGNREFSNNKKKHFEAGRRRGSMKQKQ